MGWSYGWDSKASLIAELTKGYETETHKTLKYAVRGSEMYALVEMTGKEHVTRFVAVYLIKKSGNWGYKSMDESMHPYYYACPLSYLDECTEPMNDGSVKWREKVRAYHAREAMAKKARVGSTVKLSNGMVIKITGAKPLIGMCDGVTYKVPRKMISEVIA